MRKFAFLFFLLFALVSAFSQTTYSTISSSSVLDWNSASSWEDIDGDGTGDKPDISGKDSLGDVTINLNASVTCSSQLTFNDSDSKKITINTNGNNFTSSAAWIFVAVSGSGVSKNANVSVTGGGTVSVDTLDFPESGSHSLTVDSGSTFRIEKKFYGNANSTIMTFTGSGTLYIPASGADLNFGNSGIVYDSSLEVLPVGDPSYYKISSDGSSIHSANGIGITFTVDRTGDSGATSAVPFTYTAVSKGSASLSDFTFLGAELSSTGSLTVTGNDLTRHLRYAPSDPSKTLAAGAGVTLTFSTPDGSMVLAEISWIQDEPHWIGITSTDWNIESNWSNGAVPSGTDKVVISSGCPRYPEIDAEVEAASVVVNSNARFTVVSGGKLTASSVTCNGNSRIELSGGTLASASFIMKDYGYIHATGSGLTGGTVEFTGNSTWNPDYPDRTTFYNVIVDSGVNLTTACNLNADGNFKLLNGNLILNNNINLRAAEFELNGTVDGTAGGSTPYTLTLNVPSVTSTENQVYDCNVSLASNTAISASGGKNISFNYPITSNGKTLSVTTDGSGSVFFGSSGSSLNAFADSAALTLKAPGVIYGDNTFTSFKSDVSAFGTAKSILFESGKTQTIAFIDTKGLNGALLSLGSTSTAKWKVYFTAIPAITDFSYTEISNSESVDSSGTLRELELIPSVEGVHDTNPVSTKAWFLHKYYWIGGFSTKWTDAENWAYDEDGILASPVPDYTDGSSEIIISKTGAHDLELDSESSPLSQIQLSLSSLLIRPDNRFAIADYRLSLTQDTAGAFTNNGTFALFGTQTVPVISFAAGGTTRHGDDSTIEYYGTTPANDIYCVSAASGVNNFKKLVIASGSDVTFSNNTSAVSIVNNGTVRIPVALSSDTITFTVSSAGNFLNAGTGNVLITGDGTAEFAGTFTNNGTLTASSGDLHFSGNYSGMAGTLTASSSNTYFAGNVDLSGTTFTHSNGTVVFNGTEVELTAKADGTTVFNDVRVVAGSSVSIVSSTASSFTVSGNLINQNAPGAADSFSATAGTITFNKNSSTDGNLTISGNNFFYNLLFASGVQASLTDRLSVAGTTVIANGAGNAFSSTAANTFTGIVYLGTTGSGAVQAGNVSLTGSNTFTAGVTINNADVTINNADDVVLNSASDFTIATSAACDSLEVKSAVTLAGTVTTSGNQIYNGAVTGNNSITLDTGSTNGSSYIEFHGNVTTAQNQIYKSQVRCASSITLETTGSSGAVQIGAGLVTSALNSVTVNSDLYVSGAGTIGGGTNAVSVLKNAYFACASSSAVMVLSSDFSADNVVLLGGTLQTDCNVTAAKDIVLLNGNTADIYKDGTGTAGSGTSGVTDLFRYIRTVSNSDTAKSSLDSLPSAYPDGSTGFPDGTENPYCGQIDSAALAGKTLTCGKNFYANGVDLAPTGVWNLAISDTDNASVRFAEMYNLTVANCNASYWVSAAEGCIDGGGNTNIDFERPAITAGGIYTVYDDVIRLEFNKPIENSNNEISKAASSIFYSGGAFAETYIDADCTISTDGQGDVGSSSQAVFYIKTQSAEAKKWNTDATGISSGDEQSTTRNGTHSECIPYLNLPKALTTVFATLRDTSKNRIYHYYSPTVSLAAENSSAGAAYTAVSDKASPVLIAVSVGQELHTPYSGTYDSQPPYDAHNFIEFQYSEAVEIPYLTTDNVEGSGVNVQSSSTFGNVSGTSGLSIAGLAQLSSGSISCGSNDGTAVSEIHALYRNFATTVSDAETYNSSYSNPQTHRLRIGIASYVNGTVTPSDGNQYRKWIGYINSAASPGASSKVTRVDNTLIKDLSDAQNALDSTGTALKHKLPDLYVNARATAQVYDSVLYGSWDVSAPSFAPFRAKSSWASAGSATEFEAIGRGDTGSSYLNRIEIHLFDNTPSYTTGDSVYSASWRSRIGWTSGYSATDETLKATYSYAADIFGGAQPFAFASTSSRATGGIRYCTLYNQSSNFKYTTDLSATPSLNFDTSDIIHSAKSNAFNGYGASRSVTSLGVDALYFSIPLVSSTGYNLKQTFRVSYDASSGIVTDLAGNRLKSAVIQTMDLSSPEFSITLAPLGSSKLYILFTKVINVDSFANPADNTQQLDSLTYIPKCLELVGGDDHDTPSTDLTIDENTPATLVYSGTRATAFVITLSRNVTLSDVKSLYVCVKNNGSGTDPVTGLPANVSYIQDYIGNYTPVHKAHALSDFAVGAVNVNYAYDNRLLDEEGSVVSNLLNADSWAIHDFDADQKNYGTLLANHDITINLSLYDGTSDNSGGLLDSSGNLLLGFPYFYADTSPDKKSLATEFNENTGSSCRIWLPDVTTDVFKAFSAENNTGYIDFQGTALSGNSLTFTLPVTTDSLYSSWKAGNQVSFIFGLTDSSDNNIKIRHTPVYPSEGNYNGVSGTEYPLYAVRQLSSKDFASIDLWSFRLKNIVLQRGGVTILNNVINVNGGESSVVQVDMPSAGNLNVIVLTLDGNVIKYLHHGRAEEGTHYYYWDGRNNGGNKVARGLYFVRVAGEGIDETRKIMVIKE